MRVALLTIYIAAHLGSILPLVLARRLTGFGGSQLSHVVVAMPGYARVELDYPLDVNEVCKLMKEKSMPLLNDMQPNDEKQTDGKVDPEGKHYSSHNYKGRVKMPGTSRGKGREITMGITDYEYFGKAAWRNKCGRREGRRHFFAKGSPKFVDAVIEAFKTVIPQTL